MKDAFIGNRYQLCYPIGSGGMGSIYLAIDLLNQQKIALKQVNLDYSDVQSQEANEIRLALASEFRILSTIRHPNVIDVIDYGFHNFQPFFTMEYLHNAKPIDIFAQDLSPTEKLKLFIPVLQALTHLHRHNVLHCDLKPGKYPVNNGW